MQIEHVRSTARMETYDVDGVQVMTTPGSVLEDVLKQLKTLSRPYFTSMDLKGDTMRVSGALRSLVKKGAITRSEGVLSVHGQERYYLFFGLRYAGAPGRQLVESHLCGLLPQNVVDLYRRIRQNVEALDNYEIHDEFGTGINLAYLENFIRNGLLGKRYIKRWAATYVDATFYFAPELEEKIDGIIKERIEASILRRIEAINKGKEFENEIYAAFGGLIAGQQISFRIFDWNKQVRKELKGRLRIFDAVAYMAPFLNDNGVWKPLKWFHGSIKLVIEMKYNFRITKGFLAEYLLDVREAYGDLAVPVIVAGGDTGFGAVYDSGWQFAKQHDGVWLLTGSSLDALLTASQIPGGVCYENNIGVSHPGDPGSPTSEHA